MVVAGNVMVLFCSSRFSLVVIRREKFVGSWNQIGIQSLLEFKGEQVKQ